MARTRVFDEQEVLGKAMRLFWKQGYNATSAQDLVDTLGINRSSIYDTFGDKHSLFVKVLELYRSLRIDGVLKNAATTEDPEAFIKSIFSAAKNEATQNDQIKGCLIVNSAVELACMDPEVAALLQSIMDDTTAAFRKAIKKGQEMGVFTNNHSAQSLARFVFNSLNGLRVTVKFETNKKIFDEIAEVCLSALKR